MPRFLWVPSDLASPRLSDGKGDSDGDDDDGYKRQRKRRRTQAQTTNKSFDFYYGWNLDDCACTVVAGGISAFDLQDALNQLDTLRDSNKEVPARERNALTIVAQSCLCHSSDRKGKATQVERLPCVNLSPLAARQCNGEHHNVVLYDIPNRSSYQFLSLVPLQLDLNSYTAPPGSRARSDQAEESDVPLRYKLAQSIKLSWSTPARPVSVQLDQVVSFINYVSSLRTPPDTKKKRSKPSLEQFELYDPIRIAASYLSSALLTVFNTPLPLTNGMALTDLSATVQQIDVRLSQASTWADQFRLIYATHLSETPSKLAKRRAHYIQLYNTLWLIANDVIIGTACMSFCLENSDYLADQLGQMLHSLCVKNIIDLVAWLDSWPMGIKLNDELSGAFRAAVTACTESWHQSVLDPILPWLPTMIRFLAFSGLAGTTMFLSALSDLLAVLTGHIFLVYVTITFIFAWHVRLLDALFNLFRGRKYNVLRKRVEPASYDADQLLLGTLLFVLAAFLFPTVLAYYFSFAACRLAIIGLHVLLEGQLAFLNHFPLFAVMLRLKDPKRLPGGLTFELVNDETLAMKNKPLALSGIFFQHIQLSRRLASHYSPLYLLGRLLTGRMISPIARVRLRLWVKGDAVAEATATATTTTTTDTSTTNGAPLTTVSSTTSSISTTTDSATSSLSEEATTASSTNTPSTTASGSPDMSHGSSTTASTTTAQAVLPAAALTTTTKSKLQNGHWN